MSLFFPTFWQMPAVSLCRISNGYREFKVLVKGSMRNFQPSSRLLFNACSKYREKTNGYARTAALITGIETVNQAMLTRGIYP